MKFFHEVKNSVYNPQFYASIQGQGFSSSLKYFAKLSLFVACLASIVPIIGILSVLIFKQDALIQARMGIIDVFPQELSLQLQNGEVITNVNEPYAIKMPQSLSTMLQSDRSSQRGDRQDDNRQLIPENLIVINTQKQIETGDFEAYNTALIVGKNYVGIINRENGKVELENLQDIDANGTLDKASFETLVNKVWKFIFILGIVVTLFLPVFLFLFFFFGHLIYMLFGACIVWLVTRMTAQQFTYSQAYINGLHLITLPLLMYAVAPFIFFAPLIFTLVLAVMTYVNFVQKKTAGTMTDTVESSASVEEAKDAEIISQIDADETKKSTSTTESTKKE